MYWTYRFELVAQPKFRDNNGKMIDRNRRTKERAMQGRSLFKRKLYPKRNIDNSER